MFYTQQELFTCIDDCLREPLPEDGWYAAQMKVKLEEDGTINAHFYFYEDEDCEGQKLRMHNNIAPMNAAYELQKLMAKQGNYWQEIVVNVYCNGREGNYSVR